MEISQWQHGAVDAKGVCTRGGAGIDLYVQKEYDLCARGGAGMEINLYVQKD
jgi:hypothetical protein